MSDSWSPIPEPSAYEVALTAELNWLRERIGWWQRQENLAQNPEQPVFLACK